MWFPKTAQDFENTAILMFAISALALCNLLRLARTYGQKELVANPSLRLQACASAAFCAVFLLCGTASAFLMLRH